MLKKHYLYLILSIFIMFTGVMFLSFDNNFKENNNVQISEAAVNIKTEILGVYGAGGKMGANMVFEHLLCSVRFGDNYEHDQEKIQYNISSTATATFSKTTSHTNFPIRAGRRLWVKSVNYIDGLSDGRIIMRGNYRALVEGSHHHYDAGNSGDGYFDCYIYYTTRYTLNKQGGSNGTNYVYYDTYVQHLENNATNGVQISSITIPTRTGYTFKGYYTRQNGGGTQCFDSNGNFISSSITRSNANVSVLYANWEANKYNVNFDATNLASYSPTLSFNAAGGNISTSLSGNELLTKINITSTNNNWSGVYISVSSLTIGKKYDWSIDIKSTHNHPLVLIGHEQGGTLGDVSISTSWQTVQYTFVASSNTRQAFVIYSNNLSPGEAIYIKNLTLQESDESVTPADQAIPSMTYTYDSTYSTLPTPTRFGYNFVGWYTAKSGGTQITTSTKVTTASNHTLYSDWEAKEYSVNLDPNGGSVTQGQIKVRYREKYGTLPTPTRKGYTFKGWWTDPSGGSEITSNTTFTLGAAQTLYAHWKANTYQVTFDDQGGVINFADMIDISYATYSNGIYNYTINGVTLTYNVVTSELTLNGTVQGSFTVLLSKGIELKENDIYQVTYRYISGSPGSTGVGRMVIDACDSNGNNLTARQYLNFIEPLCTSGSRTEALTINSAGAKGNGLKIWFWYNGARTFTNYKIEIKINKTGEQSVKKQGTVIYNELLRGVSIPTKYGYNFAGYYTQPNGQGTQYYDSTGKAFNNKTWNIANNATLYAKWTAKTNCVLTFNANGGEVSEASRNQTYNAVLGTLPIPTKSGYIFTGWYTSTSGGSEVTSSTKMTSLTMTIYAHWIETWAKHVSKPKGNGSTSDPYKIASAENLAWIINNHSTQYYKLTNHIDMSKYYWEPIGTVSQPFASAFNGNGYTIYGIHTISQSLRRDNGGDNSGLFGVTKNAIITNLYVKDAEINGRNNVGGIIGSATNSTIKSVAIEGQINGQANIGGIAGTSSGTTINDCLIIIEGTTSSTNNGLYTGTATISNTMYRINGIQGKSSGTFDNWVYVDNMEYPLPSGLSWLASGGEIDDKILKLWSATNLIPNGDMEGTGWDVKGSSMSYTKEKAYSGEYSVKIIGTTTVPEVLLKTSTGIVLDPSHKYYVSIYGYQDQKIGNESVECYWPIAEPTMGSIQSKKAGQWQHYSWLVTRTSFTAGTYALRFDFNNQELNTTIYYDNAKMIDLTAIFGAGNEPSQAWLDEHEDLINIQ